MSLYFSNFSFLFNLILFLFYFCLFFLFFSHCLFYFRINITKFSTMPYKHLFIFLLLLNNPILKWVLKIHSFLRFIVLGLSLVLTNLNVTQPIRLLDFQSTVSWLAECHSSYYDLTFSVSPLNAHFSPVYIDICCTEHRTCTIENIKGMQSNKLKQSRRLIRIIHIFSVSYQVSNLFLVIHQYDIIFYVSRPDRDYVIHIVEPLSGIKEQVVA